MVPENDGNHTFQALLVPNQGEIYFEYICPVCNETQQDFIHDEDDEVYCRCGAHFKVSRSVTMSTLPPIQSTPRTPTA